MSDTAPPPPAAPRRRGGPERRPSLWAIGSILCSLALCPPLCLIGPVLGLVGLGQIRRHPELVGRRLAIAGITLGLVLTAAWGGGAWWWNVNVRRPLIEGPHAALARGLAGDVAGFKAELWGAARNATDAEAAEFLDTIGRRYGSLRSIRQREIAPDPDAPVDRTQPRVPYAFEFERGSVDGAAVFVMSDPSTGALVLRFGSIHLHDDEAGDLTYPLAVGVAHERPAGEGASEHGHP